jgi:ribosomal protein S21
VRREFYESPATPRLAQQARTGRRGARALACYRFDRRMTREGIS